VSQRNGGGDLKKINFFYTSFVRDLFKTNASRKGGARKPHNKGEINWAFLVQLRAKKVERKGMSQTQFTVS